MLVRESSLPYTPSGAALFPWASSKKVKVKLLSASMAEGRKPHTVVSVGAHTLKFLQLKMSMLGMCIYKEQEDTTRDSLRFTPWLSWQAHSWFCWTAKMAGLQQVGTAVP